MLLFFKNWDLDHLSSTAIWVQLETLDSVIFQSSKRCHLYTWSWNVPREVIFRGMLNNPMVKLHSVQHFQWDDFHGTQFSRIPWKLPSQDPMWKNKTSHVFHLAAIEKKSVYLCQWFSAKAIYVLKRKKKKKKKACWLFLGTFSSELFFVVRLHYCKQNTATLCPTN